MKPSAFGYARPASIVGAIDLLAREPGARIIAGGQTLGPMLNLRLARPTQLIDISRIPALIRIEETADAVTLGAGITHAAIEDGRVPDFTNGFLAHVAQGIAYRAIRNRGTIGGSLANGDPAADWIAALAALGADVIIEGGKGRRTAPVLAFIKGAMQTDLAHDEIVTGVRIPRLAAGARWGFHKICRKTGEFADAIGVVVEHGSGRRCISGATGGAPIAVPMASASVDDCRHELAASGYKGDAYDMQVHAVALARAVAEAEAR